MAYLYANSLIYTGSVKKTMDRFNAGEHILSIYFHDPSKELFEKTIKWLQEYNSTFISTIELQKIISGEINPPPSAVVLTVDDGWKGNKKNVIELANRYGIPVTIFVSLDPVVQRRPFWWSFVEKEKQKGFDLLDVKTIKRMTNSDRLAYLNQFGFKYTIEHEAMTVSEIMEADALPNIYIESHTVSHPILTKCTDMEAETEIMKSKQDLEAILGRPVTGFAYPNGSHGVREIGYLKKHGYKYAFCTVPGYLHLQNLKKPYSLPRFEVFDEISFAENICRISGVWFKNPRNYK
jgi:peptidoglycan/xylan/chitin deacetylase (PgdA/CDA1 family)